MIYCANDSGDHVSHSDFAKGIAETHNFTFDRWREDNELWAMCIGELWLNEIRQGDAEAIIRRRKREFYC